jgi:hypothetical protein
MGVSGGPMIIPLAVIPVVAFDESAGGVEFIAAAAEWPEFSKKAVGRAPGALSSNAKASVDMDDDPSSLGFASATERVATGLAIVAICPAITKGAGSQPKTKIKMENFHRATHYYNSTGGNCQCGKIDWQVVFLPGSMLWRDVRGQAGFQEGRSPPNEHKIGVLDAIRWLGTNGYPRISYPGGKGDCRWGAPRMDAHISPVC